LFHHSSFYLRYVFVFFSGERPEVGQCSGGNALDPRTGTPNQIPLLVSPLLAYVI